MEIKILRRNSKVKTTKYRIQEDKQECKENDKSFPLVIIAGKIWRWFDKNWKCAIFEDKECCGSIFMTKGMLMLMSSLIVWETTGIYHYLVIQTSQLTLVSNDTIMYIEKTSHSSEKHNTFSIELFIHHLCTFYRTLNLQRFYSCPNYV